MNAASPVRHPAGSLNPPRLVPRAKYDKIHQKSMRLQFFLLEQTNLQFFVLKTTILDAYHLNVLYPDQRRTFEDCVHSCVLSKIRLLICLLLYWLFQ